MSSSSPPEPHLDVEEIEEAEELENTGAAERALGESRRREGGRSEAAAG